EQRRGSRRHQAARPARAARGRSGRRPSPAAGRRHCAGPRGARHRAGAERLQRAATLIPRSTQVPVEHHPPKLDPETEAAIQRLRTYPFLKPLSETVLRKLQPNLVERKYAAGETILRTGEYSDAAFYIKSGVVEVLFSAVNAPTVRPGEGREVAGAAAAAGAHL